MILVQLKISVEWTTRLFFYFFLCTMFDAVHFSARLLAILNARPRSCLKYKYITDQPAMLLT